MSPDPIPQLLAHLRSDSAFLQNGHPELFLARAPARLDVIGGLSEYAGSLACQLPLAAASAVALQRRDDRQLLIKNYNADNQHQQFSISLDDFYGTAALLPVSTLQKLFAANPWAAHIAGAFPILAKHKKITRRTHGANIACFSAIPFHAGLASSAALQCATLWALAAAYHFILDPLEIALLAHKIENQIVGTRAGVMEPAVSVLGRQDQLLLLQCQPHEPKGYVSVPPGLMFAGLQFGHKDAAAACRATRVSSFIAQAIITKFYADTGTPRDPTAGYLARLKPDAFHRYFHPMLPESITGADFLKYHPGIPDRLTTVDPAATYFPRAAAEFHITENARAHDLVSLLQKLSPAAGASAAPLPPTERRQLAAQAGALMLASHTACSALARLGSKRADTLVELITRRGPDKGLYGAKIAGGEGGGGVTLLLEISARPLLDEIAAEFQTQTGAPIQIATGSSSGCAEAAPRRISLADVTA